jgi:hypothetical protein
MVQHGLERLKPGGIGFFQSLPVIANVFQPTILSSSNVRGEQDTTVFNLLSVGIIFCCTARGEIQTPHT